jgi:hypothetical protein
MKGREEKVATCFLFGPVGIGSTPIRFHLVRLVSALFHIRLKYLAEKAL